MQRRGLRDTYLKKKKKEKEKENSGDDRVKAMARVKLSIWGQDFESHSRGIQWKGFERSSMPTIGED